MFDYKKFINNIDQDSINTLYNQQFQSKLLNEKKFFELNNFVSTNFKDYIIANLHKTEYFNFINSFKSSTVGQLDTAVWWTNSWFYTYNCLISLVFLITAVFLIGLFLPKNPKGISILNVVSAFSILLFLFFLPIPHYSAIKNLVWYDYNLFVYIYIIISGIFTASFLAINNEVTFLKENKHIEYPILILLTYVSGIVAVASENFIAVFLALESITLISAVLIGFQRTNNLSTLASVRYIFFSAVPGGALVLGISEIYAYTGAFNFSDMEKLLIQYDVSSLYELNANQDLIGQLILNSLELTVKYSWDVKFEQYVNFNFNEWTNPNYAEINILKPYNNISTPNTKGDQFANIILNSQNNYILAQFINYEFNNSSNANTHDTVLSLLGQLISVNDIDADTAIKKGKYAIYKYIDTYLYNFIADELVINWVDGFKFNSLNSDNFQAKLVTANRNFIDFSINLFTEFDKDTNKVEAYQNLAKQALELFYSNNTNAINLNSNQANGQVINPTELSLASYNVLNGNDNIINIVINNFLNLTQNVPKIENLFNTLNSDEKNILILNALNLDTNLPLSNELYDKLYYIITVLNLDQNKEFTNPFEQNVNLTVLKNLHYEQTILNYFTNMVENNFVPTDNSLSTLKTLSNLKSTMEVALKQPVWDTYILTLVNETVTQYTDSASLKAFLINFLVNEKNAIITELNNVNMDVANTNISNATNINNTQIENSIYYLNYLTALQEQLTIINVALNDINNTTNITETYVVDLLNSDKIKHNIPFFYQKFELALNLINNEIPAYSSVQEYLTDIKAELNSVINEKEKINNLLLIDNKGTSTVPVIKQILLNNYIKGAQTFDKPSTTNLIDLRSQYFSNTQTNGDVSQHLIISAINKFGAAINTNWSDLFSLNLNEFTKVEVNQFEQLADKLVQNDVPYNFNEDLTNRPSILVHIYNNFLNTLFPNLNSSAKQLIIGATLKNVLNDNYHFDTNFVQNDNTNSFITFFNGTNNISNPTDLFVVSCCTLYLKNIYTEWINNDFINSYFYETLNSSAIRSELADYIQNSDFNNHTTNSITLVGENHIYSLPLIINVAVFLIIFYILFKLTAAPFHVWAPSIYEGAPLPVTIFLSVFSKITMVFLLMKLLTFYFYFLYTEWSYVLIFSGLASIIVGIYGAISETRIKRFFVYSSMGHVGFMLLGIAAGGLHGMTATILYVIIYTITVFIGWTVLFTSNIKITHINQLNGLSKINPTLSFIIAISMLSMSGIPPLAGFFVKFEVLYALVESEYYSIVLIALLLTVFSFFYYLRIIKILYFEPLKSYRLQFRLNKTQALILAICFLLLVNFSLYFQQPIVYYIKNIIIQSIQ